MNHLRSLSREKDRELLDGRDRSLELRESLLGQALEGGPTLIVPPSMQQVMRGAGHFVEVHEFQFLFCSNVETRRAAPPRGLKR